MNNLTKGLGKEVYGEDVIAVIEATRLVLDLTGLAVKCKGQDGSYMKVAAIEFPQFMNAISAVPVTSLKEVPVDELRHQYRLFLERLSRMTSKFTEAELKGMDSKELIKKFFHPSENEFEGIEMIMQVNFILLELFLNQSLVFTRL